jgi:hypothetical protein
MQPIRPGRIALLETPNASCFIGNAESRRAAYAASERISRAAYWNIPRHIGSSGILDRSALHVPVSGILEKPSPDGDRSDRRALVPLETPSPVPFFRARPCALVRYDNPPSCTSNDTETLALPMIRNSALAVCYVLYCATILPPLIREDISLLTVSLETRTCRRAPPGRRNGAGDAAGDTHTRRSRRHTHDMPARRRHAGQETCRPGDMPARRHAGQEETCRPGDMPARRHAGQETGDMPARRHAGQETCRPGDMPASHMPTRLQETLAVGDMPLLETRRV